MQAMFNVNMDPSKKTSASIAALDLNEATSLPLNHHLHHLLLSKFGITNIQACKAALQDQTPSLMIKCSQIQTLKNGRKVHTMKSHS